MSTKMVWPIHQGILVYLKLATGWIFFNKRPAF